MLEAMDEPLKQEYYAVVREADDGRDSEAVDWNFDASQVLQPGDVFSGGISCAIALDGGNPMGTPNKEQIIKEECYVFDFARTGRCGRSPTTVAG